jgi:hypothetical protein
MASRNPDSAGAQRKKDAENLSVSLGDPPAPVIKSFAEWFAKEASEVAKKPSDSQAVYDLCEKAYRKGWNDRGNRGRP